MKRFYRKLISISLLIFTVSNANAAYILNGSASVDALSLSNSFSDFYDYSGSVGASSNTGLEQTDSAVFFVAEYLGGYGLFGLIDATIDIGDTSAGSIDMTLTDNSTNGLQPFILLDDPAEQSSSSFSTIAISYVWGSRANDGFVYDLGNSGDEISLDFIFSNINGITDFVFLSFSNGSSAPTEIALTNEFSLSQSQGSVQVSAPNILFLMVLSIFIVSTRFIFAKS